jgi:hypothetical protein
MPRTYYPEQDPTISDPFKRVIAENALEIASVYALLDKMEKHEREVRYGPDPQEGPKDAVPITIPANPPGVDIDWNIRRARESTSFTWFLDKVSEQGEMDYKLRDTQGTYEDFGNFNFGAVALAFGFTEETALRAAGLVQILVNEKRRLKNNDYIGACPANG